MPFLTHNLLKIMLSWITRIFHSLEFLGIYVWEVVKSNLVVAHDVLTPRHRMTPAWLELDLSSLSDKQILAYSNLVTMTPGTLSVDVTPDGRYLTVHAMYAESPREAEEELTRVFKERIRRVF